MNVSEPTIKALYELTGKAFYMNRIWDATVSILGVTYVCPRASWMIHQKIAHWYPQIADVITENCLENFNIVAYYPATPAGDVSYTGLTDMMEQMLDKTIQFQNDVMATRQIAQDNQDYSIVVEIDKVLLEVNKQVSQMLLINDKAQLYGDSPDGLTSFDKDVKKFFYILGDD